MATMRQELVVILLSIAGPMVSYWLWREERKGTSVAFFLAAVALASFLTIRWNIGTGL
jgi:hypothetical protein